MKSYPANYVTKEERKMRDKQIMLELTNLLMKESLITPEEKMKAAEMIKAANDL